jgi:integrase
MSAIKKRGRWYFRKRVKGHGRIFVSPSDYGLSNTKVGAEESGRRRIAELLDGRKAPVVASASPTLAAFEAVYLEHSEAKNEYSSVKAKRQILRDHLVPAFGPTPLDRITFASIEDLKNRLIAARPDGADGLSNKTVNNVLTVLRRLLVLAHKRGALAVVPEFEWLPTTPGTFDFMTFEESEDLIEAASGEWQAMILVGIRCGLRQGELIGLKWEHVDLKLNRIVVRQSIVRGRTKGTKSRRVRVVDLGIDAALALTKHRHLRGPYVFCDLAGNHLTTGECKWPLYTACDGARLRRIGWHVLRHTFCSQLAMRGASPQAIQKLAGHATLAMTERYMHLSPNVTADAVKLLDRGAQKVPTARRNVVRRRDRTG